MASPTRWTWAWDQNSGSWRWTGRPGVLQSMGLQRVRHNWANKLNWLKLSKLYNSVDKTGVPIICWFLKITLPVSPVGNYTQYLFHSFKIKQGIETKIGVAGLEKTGEKNILAWKADSFWWHWQGNKTGNKTVLLSRKIDVACPLKQVISCLSSINSKV